MCYEIFCAWIALTPIFLVIAVWRARRTSAGDFLSSTIDTMLKLYGLSLYATFLTMGLFLFAMIPVFVCILIVSQFVEIDVNHVVWFSTVLALAIWAASHLYLGCTWFRANSQQLQKKSDASNSPDCKREMES